MARRHEAPTLVGVDDEVPSDPLAVDRDAKEFGAHYKQGGWRLGLLVARSVYLNDHGGDRASSHCELENKITAQEFADKAGVSVTKIRLYFHAWELAAADGGRVATPDALVPGQEDIEGLGQFDEDDESLREDWPKFMKKAREPKKPAGEPKQRKKRQSKQELTEDQIIEIEDTILNNALGDLLERARVLVADVKNVSETALDDEDDLLDQIAEQGEELTKTAQALKSIKQLDD